MRLLIILGLSFSLNAFAADELVDMDREPAAVTPASKRAYPGGLDEEDLRVQTTLPEASLRTDSRSVQREVYRSLYNQELKEDRPEPIEE